MMEDNEDYYGNEDIVEDDEESNFNTVDLGTKSQSLPNIVTTNLTFNL